MLAAAVWAGVAWQEARQVSRARATAERRVGETKKNIAALELRLEMETQRAEAVERDNAILRSAVQRVETAARRVVEPATREVIETRIQQALARLREGEATAVLRELLWCFDEGMARDGGLTSGQLSIVAGALAKLGERAPTAIVALRERLERARRRVMGGAHDFETMRLVREIAAISRALKDESALVALLDAIPEGDSRRARVAFEATERLIALQRYGDVLVGLPYRSMQARFEALAREPAGGVGASRVASVVAKDIEVLAGAGDLVHARELAGRVLALDGSEATRALLQKHLERAGQAGLLAPESGK